MYKVTWVIALVSMVTADFTFTCPQVPHQDGPAIPQLPDQYEMRVETNIVQSKSTVEVMESYDFPGNRVALTMIRDGQVMKSIHNYQTEERYDFLPNGTCVTSKIDMTDPSNNVFGFSVKDKDGHIHIASVSDIFKTSAKYNNSYVGQTTVRGIPVYHWTSCEDSSQMHAVFKLDFYFSTPEYKTAEGNTNVPIRFTITGQAKNTVKAGYHNFSHVYEFSQFKPGPIKDPTVFESPIGVVCVGRSSSLPLPKIPDQLTYNMEVDWVGTKRPFNRKVYFDYHLQTIRMDRFITKNETAKYGYGTITHIEDFRIGLEYVIDRDEGNCTVHKMPNTSWFATPSSGKIHMMHAYELMKFKNLTFVYQGERQWRGLSVHAWGNFSNNVVHEYFFLKQPQVTQGLPPYSVPVGMYIKNITQENIHKGQGQATQGQITPPPPPNKGQPQPQPEKTLPHFQMPYEMHVHLFDYHEGHHDPEVFDISLCYHGTNPYHALHFQLSVLGNYEKDVYGHKSLFYPALRNVLAQSADVTPLRITNIKVWQDDKDDKKLIISFTLLDKTPFTGDKETLPRQAPLAEAQRNLLHASNLGIYFNINYDPQHFMHFIATSIETVQSEATNLSMVGTSYSPGAMAGLGIGMIIFGCIIGLLIAFVIHKRIDTEVPYVKE